METREDIPLKSNSKSSSFHSCNEYFFEGSRFITTAFMFLTIVITIALLLQIYYGDFQVVPHGSVATDSKDCSEIGTLILKQGGNSVDAAIAAAICLAVVCPHTSGLDATAAILIYSHKSRENPASFDFVDNVDTNQTLPKLIVNLAQLHEIYGHLPWKEILTPSAELARRGFLVSNQLVQAIKKTKAKKLFKQVEAGGRMSLENLADTLRRISEIPSKEIYKMAKSSGKIIKRLATKKLFRNYNIFYPKSHNIGEILYLNLERIEKMKFTQKDVNGIDYLYNLANASLNIYNEYNFWSEFHQGTASNIAVMDLDDFYVSLIVGMHSPFGSQQMTNNGYIIDNKTSAPYTILPVIATDARFICAKRIVFGLNDVCVATQIISSWAYSTEDATTIIEYPRFTFLNNSVIGLEGVYVILPIVTIATKVVVELKPGSYRFATIIVSRLTTAAIDPLILCCCDNKNRDLIICTDLSLYFTCRESNNSRPIY